MAVPNHSPSHRYERSACTVEHRPRYCGCALWRPMGAEWGRAVMEWHRRQRRHQSNLLWLRVELRNYLCTLLQCDSPLRRRWECRDPILPADRHGSMDEVCVQQRSHTHSDLAGRNSDPGNGCRDGGRLCVVEHWHIAREFNLARYRFLLAPCADV